MNFEEMSLLLDEVINYLIKVNKAKGYVVNKLLDIAKTGILINNRDYVSNALNSLIKYLELD